MSDYIDPFEFTSKMKNQNKLIIIYLPEYIDLYDRYVMTCSTPEKAEGLALLTEGCRVVEEKIKAAGGNFAIQMAPKVGCGA